MKRLVAVLLLIGTVFISGCINQESRHGFESPVYQTITNTIVDDTLVVEPGQYTYYQFSVPEEAGVVTLNGEFRVTGGSGNDIMVYVFEADDFINWKNGHESRAYYQSGKKTVDSSISVNLGPGTYFLVYSNTFSLVSNKAVRTKFYYTYEKCVKYC